MNLTSKVKDGWARWKLAHFYLRDIQDVDVSTTPPADGDALVWVDADKKWEPGVAGGSTIDAIDASSDGTVVVEAGGPTGRFVSNWTVDDAYGPSITVTGTTFALAVGVYWVEAIAAGDAGIKISLVVSRELAGYESGQQSAGSSAADGATIQQMFAVNDASQNVRIGVDDGSGTLAVSFVGIDIFRVGTLSPHI